MKLEGHSVHIPDNNNTLCTHSVITNGLCSLSCHQGLGWMPSQFVLHCCSCIVTNEYHIIAETIAEWHCLLFSLFQKWLGGSLFWGVLSESRIWGFLNIALKLWSRSPSECMHFVVSCCQPWKFHPNLSLSCVHTPILTCVVSIAVFHPLSGMVLWLTVTFFVIPWGFTAKLTAHVDDLVNRKVRHSNTNSSAKTKQYI